jgi:hypothetical protein
LEIHKEISLAKYGVDLEIAELQENKVNKKKLSRKCSLYQTYAMMIPWNE